jgi:hypothetical protein
MWRKNQFDLKFKLIEKQFDEVTSTFDDDKKNKFYMCFENVHDFPILKKKYIGKS